MRGRPLYLPDEAYSDVQQGKSFLAKGVYNPLSDNRKIPTGGVKIETTYDCSI